MFQRTTFAVVVAWLLVSIPFHARPASPPADVPGWQAARWGMTEADLLQAFGHTLTKLPSSDRFYGAYGNYVIPSLELAGQTFTVRFQMSSTTHRLAGVLIQMDERRNRPVAEGAFTSLEAWLTRQYGPPGFTQDEPNATSLHRRRQWGFPTTTIALNLLVLGDISSSHLTIRYFPTGEAPPTRDVYVETQTGLRFPATIGSLYRGDVHTYADRDPGLGVSIRYTKARACRGDIYIYHRGLAHIPSDPEAPVIVQQLQHALGDIRVFERRGNYQDVTVVSTEVIDLGERGGPRARRAVLSYREQGERQESYLYVTGYKDRFVKLRFTFAEQARQHCAPALSELSTWLSGALR